MKHPDKIAVSDTRLSMTYHELEEKSNQFASYLIKSGCKPCDIVAICMEKSVLSVVAMFGILKAGAAYLPLDTGAPLDRNAFILNDAVAKFIIIEPIKLKTLAGIINSSYIKPIVYFPGKSQVSEAVLAFGDWVIDKDIDCLQKVQVTCESLAYILYTSGSTGRPKGVVHTQKSALAFVNWAVDYFDISEKDVFSSHAPFHFDLSIFDVFVSLKVGAELCLIPKIVTAFPATLAKCVEKYGITIWYSVPSALMTLLSSDMTKHLHSLRVIIYAGEAFPYNKLKSLKENLPRTRYFNLYGPSETNVITYYEVIEKADEIKEDIPLGYACPYAKINIITEDGNEAKLGEEGELAVICDSVMLGYLNRPDLTEKCIKPHPLVSNGALCYFTGDIVKVVGKGKYAFVCRKDGMIKVKGFRVEVGEIENITYKLAEVKEAVVLAVTNVNKAIELKLFISYSGNSIGEEQVLSHLHQYLPEYMIPQEIIVQTALPRNSRGKLDLASLRSLC